MAIDFTPTQTPAGTSDGNISFTPSGQAATQQPDAGSGNYILDAAKSLGLGALNLVDKNPISSAITGLSAMPVQGLAKMMGQPDPYATPLPGVDNGAPFDSVNADTNTPAQYAEKQAGNAATVGSLFIPAAKGADLLTGGKGLIGATGRIAANTVLGGFQGAAGGMQAGQDTDQLKWSTGTGMFLGGLLSTIGEGGSAAMNKWAQKSGSTQLATMKDKLKVLANNFADNSTQTTDPIKTLEQNKLIQDLRVVDGKINTDLLTNPSGTGSLDDMIEEQKAAGTSAVKGMPGGTKVSDFKQAVLDHIKGSNQLKQAGKVSKVSNAIEGMFNDFQESYGDMIPWEEVNGVRMQMNKAYDPETWDAERAVGDAARKILYNQPGAGVALRSAMRNEQELLNAKDFIIALNTRAVKGGQLGKYLADQIGAMVGGGVATMTAPGGILTAPLGAAAGAYATDKAFGAAQSRFFNPYFAEKAKSLLSVLPALSTAKTVGQAALIPSLTGATPGR